MNATSPVEPGRGGWRGLAPLLVLGGIVLACVLVFYQVIRPLLVPLFLAAVAAVLLDPVYRWALTRVGGRAWLAAGLVTLGATALVVLPILGLIALSFNELHGAVLVLQSAREGGFSQWLQTEGGAKLAPAVESVSRMTGQDTEAIREWLLTAASQAEGLLYERTTEFLGGVPQVLVVLLLLVLALFFFLKDSPALLKGWADLSPLKPEHDAAIMDEFGRVCRGIVWGSLLAATLQSLLFGVGLFVIDLGFGTGLSGWVFLLSMVTFAFSVLPFLGAMFVWIPVAVVMFLEGQVAAAVCLSLYGSLIVSQTDTVVRIWVLKDTVKMHPVVMFVSVVGGVQLMGFVGIFVGPMLAAVLVTLLKILKREMLTRSRPEPGAEDKSKTELDRG